MIMSKYSIFFNWRISALQCCVGFCHTIMQNSHKYTHAPSLLNLLPTSHPIPSLQVVIGHQVELPMLYNIFPIAIYFTYAVLSPTLCDPIDCSSSGSSAHGDSLGKNTVRVTMPSFRGPSQPRNRTQVSHIAGDPLLSESPGKPHIKYSY